MRTTFAGLWLFFATLVLAGCPSHTRLRSPGEAYRLEPGSVTPETRAAAQEAVKRTPANPDTARMRFILARSACDSGKQADMEYQISRIEKDDAGSPWLPPARHLRLLASRDTEGALRFLQSVNDELKRFPADAIFQENVRALVPAALKKCAQSDLESFLAGSSDEPLTPDARLALGRLLKEQGRNDEAVRTLRALVTQFPASPAAADAFSLLRQLSKDAPTNPSAVGVLLPMSGKYTDYGTCVSQAIKLAADDMEAAGHKFEFVFVDTGEDADQPLNGMESAIKKTDTLVTENNVIALFGPLFSSTALVCAAEANALGVVLLTPSALDAKLTQTGPYVFRAALTPERQARSMAEYGVKNLGYRRFGILAPESAYGRSLAASFTMEASALGATVVVESRFPAQAADFSKTIVELGGADIAAFKESEEQSHRSAQAELETFLQEFFQAVQAMPPGPDASSTIMNEEAPAVSRVACLMLTPSAFTNEIGARLRAAAQPHKSLTFLSPESATIFSAFLSRADVQTTGQLADSREIALAELLTQQATVREAPLTVLISVTSFSGTEGTENLGCAIAMYDSRTARPLAVHRFTVPHPLPPQGNRYGLDAIYIPASGSQLIHIVPQLVYHGIGLPILGSDTWNNEALRMKPEAVSLPAHFTVGFWPELDTQQTQAFTRRYQERFASPPDALAASAYDAARLLMTAILRSDGTREGLRAALSGIGSFDGLTGIMRMTPQREVEKTAVVLKIERGDVTPAR